MKKKLLLLSFIATFFSCKNLDKPGALKLETIYDEAAVKGCFLLKQLNTGQTYIYNEELCVQGFLPASTFKIPNAIAALETGVALDENLLLKWDSIPRQVPSWNQDHNLKTAFETSCVPCYQEIAKRIGTSKMQEQINKLQFGKMDIRKETLTDFWLKGDSKITPFEQLDFLERLFDNKLPIKPSTLHHLRSIMTIATDEKGSLMLGKTGWAIVEDKNIGWFVGFVERKDGERFVFVNYIEAKIGTVAKEAFMMARKNIVGKVLYDLEVL